MSERSNEERKKEFLEMQEAFRNLLENLKKAHQRMVEERKAFEVIENETVRLVVCKN
jgi:flagellar motility protein MotE (MotC chaperone)